MAVVGRPAVEAVAAGLRHGGCCRQLRTKTPLHLRKAATSGWRHNEADIKQRISVYDPLYMRMRTPEWAREPRMPTPSDPDFDDISVHNGQVLQAALCVVREPTVYVEPAYERKARIAKERFMEKTSTTTPKGPDVSFVFNFMKKRGEANLPAGEELGPITVLVEDSMNVNRYPEERLYLLVMYRDREHPLSFLHGPSVRMPALRVKPSMWCFPITDHFPEHSMRMSLQYIAKTQLGPTFLPYHVGASPIAISKHVFKQPQWGLTGRNVFYYKAYQIYDTKESIIHLDTPVIEAYGWFTAAEVRERLQEEEYCAVKASLQL